MSAPGPTDPESVEVLGVRVTDLTMSAAVARIERYGRALDLWRRARRCAYPIQVSDRPNVCGRAFNSKRRYLRDRGA